MRKQHWPRLQGQPKEGAFHGAPEWAALCTSKPRGVAPCVFHPYPALGLAQEDLSLSPALELSPAAHQIFLFPQATRLPGFGL